MDTENEKKGKEVIEMGVTVRQKVKGKGDHGGSSLPTTISEPLA